MLSISGTHIYLHHGDDCSFPIVYRTTIDDLIHNFRADDIITLRILKRNSREIILTKLAESIIVNKDEVCIFSFMYDDYDILPDGDYLYNIVIETRDGTRCTLIDEAKLSILKSPVEEFDARRLVKVESRILNLSNTSLVCKFNRTQIDRVDAEGTLILFNEPKKEIVDEDGTLILFNSVKENDEDSTLILF